MTKSDEANRARAILGDALVVNAFTKIRERQLSAFENSPPDNPAAREQAHQMLRAITLLKTELHKAIDDEAIERKVRKREND